MDKFSEEEKEIIAYFAGSIRSTWERMLLYCIVVVPMTLSAIYGFCKSDVIAMAIAFTGLLLFLLWTLSGEVRYGKLYRAVFRKLADGLKEQK